MAGKSPDAELRSAAALVFVEDLDTPVLDADDDHHLTTVLRLRAGEAVAASDGAGGWRMCEFHPRSGRAERRRPAPGGSGRARPPAAGGPGTPGLLAPAGAIRRAARSEPLVEVGLSFAKAERTEWAVAKLVELGVDRVALLVADRTVVRPEPGGTGRRAERLARIAREAAMQSRRVFLPEVADPGSLDTVVSRTPGAAIALAEPGGEQLSLATPTVVIGPEGGWSPRELRLVEHHVNLGDGVLRVETAAVAAGAILTALRSQAIALA